MKRLLFFVPIILFVAGACSTSSTTIQSKTTTKPVLFFVNDRPTYSEEFLHAYYKNKDLTTRESTDTYLDRFINFKLKVLEAEAAGIDTTAEFLKELEGYKTRLRQPYLTDKKTTEKLMKEAYTRLQSEINASHILIKVSQDAAPEDTLKAFTKITELRNSAVSGKSFSGLAKTHSQDPSAEKNGGNLGYFTALRMVYPFETAAYTTKPGEISPIIRTKFGYHIVKVHHRRLNPGKSKIAHIMVAFGKARSEAAKNAAKNRASEVYQKALNRDDWNTLCQNYSDDANSKNNGGETGWIETGDVTFTEFTDAVYKLKKAGDISPPVETPYGFHIIKLIDRKPIPDYETMRNFLQEKVSKDSRAEVSRKKLLERLKKDPKLIEFPKTQDKIKNNAVIEANGKISNLSGKLLEKSVFNIGKTTYTTADFKDFVNKSASGKRKAKPANYIDKLYEEFLNTSLIQQEITRLNVKYPEYNRQIREFKEGMMLFEITDRKIWSKTSRDTAALKQFFLQNGDAYMWGERVKAVIYNVADKEILQHVQQLILKKDYPINNTPVPDVYFKNAGTEFVDNPEDRAAILKNLQSEHTDLKIRITGYATKKETQKRNKARLAHQRAQKMAEFIENQGVEKESIQVAEGFSAAGEEVSKVTFRLFSSSDEALEALFNKEETPDRLKITRGLFQKGDNSEIDRMKHDIGVNTVFERADGSMLLVQIIDVIPPTAKKFNEAKGIVTPDYQAHLEKEWEKELRKKYKVVIQEEELKKLKKSISDDQTKIRVE